MKKIQLRSLQQITILIGIALAFQLFPDPAAGSPKEKIEADTRCPVCGMFVAKYPDWNTQIHHIDGTILVFDGTKDMMVYYLNPEKFGPHSRDSIKEIWVKDYYTLEWIDGRSAFFVIGSDTYGPMGHELIPFSSSEAAKSFLKDHHGKQILTFDEITESIVESLRFGQKMRQ